jgi:hypothetical protein
MEGQGSISGKGKKYFSIPQRPPSFIQNGGTGGSLPGVKQTGRETDHSPAFSSDVKNGGAIPPLPHTSSWCGD